MTDTMAANPAARTARVPYAEWDDETLVLGIETSCDETSAAVVKGGREILSNVIASQTELHREYGGVVPEVASRAHIEALTPAVAEALVRADVTLWDVDAVAATLGPGLIGSLLVGVAEAKAMAAALGIPFVGVNHLEGHIYSNLLSDSSVKWPALCLIISGGHTMLVDVAGHGSYEILGTTLDDAAGEAFDKVARFLGLDYPGGPEIDRLSLLGDPQAIRFPRAMLADDSLDVSYSGLKTAVINYVRRVEARDEPVSVQDVAASFQQAVVDVQVAKTLAAAERSRAERVLVCGGVAANSGLRRGMEVACKERGLQLHIPPLELCGDNAAMVAACGTELLRAGIYSALDASPDPNLPLVR
jgi:N6-L-threonylcarbamoyladenine synthase